MLFRLKSVIIWTEKEAFLWTRPPNAFEEIPNAETVAALEEGEEMLKNPATYKRYATFREALDDIQGNSP